jgi:hypothetical protein
VLDTFIHVTNVNKDIIQVYQHNLVQVWPENRIHGILKSGWGIREPKWQYLPFVEAQRRLESRLDCILWGDTQLVVSRCQIKTRKYSGSMNGIQGVINAREWIAIRTVSLSKAL